MSLKVVISVMSSAEQVLNDSTGRVWFRGVWSVKVDSAVSIEYAWFRGVWLKEVWLQLCVPLTSCWSWAWSGLGW